MIGIFYAGIVAFFIWLSNGLLIAYLKSNSVKISEVQLPGLHQVYQDLCQKFEIKEVPDLYVLQSDGLLNAFATRHSGRDFIVIYSDALDAFGPNSDKIKFLIGHELGHVRQKHIVKQLFLFPALFMPLVGNAYSRARETSCDYHGAFAVDNIDGAIDAMMLFSGGRDYSKDMSSESFSDQHYNERGFFVSWFELISGYPTLSQRVSRLLNLKENKDYQQPTRHPLAYLFALFSTGGRSSGGGNMIITIAIIAILAGLLMPALAKARESANRASARSTHEFQMSELEEKDSNSDY
jgi:Zn-dependent protease with chaperone function